MFYFLINITNNIVTTAKVKSNALVILCKNKLTIKDIIPKQSNTKKHFNGSSQAIAVSGLEPSYNHYRSSLYLRRLEMNKI